MFEKTRFDKSQQSVLYFKELMCTIPNLINLLRDKAILRREVLTPNLTPTMKILINKIPEVDNDETVEIFIDFLQDLLVSNTSVFKPYVNKYYNFLSGKLSNEGLIQNKIIQNLSTVI